MTDQISHAQACAYCGSPSYSIVAAFHDGTAVRCQGCRLVRTLPYPTFDYSDNQEYAQGYSGRERLFNRFAQEFMSFIVGQGAGKRLLEVGCGMGFLLEEAARRGFQARGLEVNRWEVELTRARGLNVQLGTLEEAHLPDASADVVCMSHVLEHVQDLHTLLGEVHRVLAPGGVMAISQPHYAAPLPQLLGHLWYGWQWTQHLWHFDVPALTRILADHGLQRSAVTYNSLYHAWLPAPFSWRPKVLAVQVGMAAMARSECWFGRGDQFFLAAHRNNSHHERA